MTAGRQFAWLKRLAQHASRKVIEWMWIDWTCAPQYPAADEKEATTMTEVMRSRLYYARARWIQRMLAGAA